MTFDQWMTFLSEYYWLKFEPIEKTGISYLRDYNSIINQWFVVFMKRKIDTGQQGEDESLHES